MGRPKGVRPFADQRARRKQVVLVYGWDFERELSGEHQESSYVDWEEIEEIWKYLTREERVVLKLMRDGKTPTDVSDILYLQDKSLAKQEMKRAVNVARFYARRRWEVESIGTCKEISKVARQAARMIAQKRMTYQAVAEKLGYKNPSTISNVLNKAIGDLVERNCTAAADMLKECCTSQFLRGRKERKIEMEERWRGELKKFLLSKAGSFWYEWGGQDLVANKVDCSGLIIEVLKMVGVLPGIFRDVTAFGLAKHFPVTVRNPKVGDLAFYGKNTNSIKHVMIYLGEVRLPRQLGKQSVYPNAVIGMSGGSKYMTLEMARMVGAGLWVKRSARYRRDFLYFRRVT